MNNEFNDSDDSMEENINENDISSDASINDKENVRPLNAYQRNKNHNISYLILFWSLTDHILSVFEYYIERKQPKKRKMRERKVEEENENDDQDDEKKIKVSLNNLYQKQSRIFRMNKRKYGSKTKCRLVKFHCGDTIVFLYLKLSFKYIGYRNYD